MEIIKTSEFNKALKRLPKDIQRLCQEQEQRFESNWRDPRLHVKKVKSLPFAFSFRITRNYRVLFYFKNISTVVFFDADHRKDIYK